MPGKCRPSLREKTLANVMRSNLSETDKECIKAVFERFVDVVRCKDCKAFGVTDYGYMYKYWVDWIPTEDDDFCSKGERRADDAKID